MNEKKITAYRLAKLADISTSDLYCAIKEQKPFYPNWRKRIAKALMMSEADVFPEYQEQKEAAINGKC